MFLEQIILISMDLEWITHQVKHKEVQGMGWEPTAPFPVWKLQKVTWKQPSILLSLLLDLETFPAGFPLQLLLSTALHSSGHSCGSKEGI